MTKVRGKLLSMSPSRSGAGYGNGEPQARAASIRRYAGNDGPLSLVTLAQAQALTLQGGPRILLSSEVPRGRAGISKIFMRTGKPGIDALRIGI
jgi:hypothetical protein